MPALHHGGFWSSRAVIGYRGASVATESWEPHFDRNPNDGGLPTEDRFVSAHAVCLAHVFRQREAERPAAQLLMGAPGSGKSAFKQAGGLGELNTAVDVDPDHYKLKLPEYPTLGAVGVHEESSWLALQARAAAIGRGCSLINDAVGSSAGKYAHLIKKLRQNGYSVRLVCLHVLSVERLWRRVQYRVEQGGRVVPETFVRDAHAKVPSVFARRQPLADSAVLVDASDVSRFAAVWERDGSGIRVHDEHFLATLEQAGEALRS